MSWVIAGERRSRVNSGGAIGERRHAVSGKAKVTVKTKPTPRPKGCSLPSIEKWIDYDVQSRCRRNALVSIKGRATVRNMSVPRHDSAAAVDGGSESGGDTSWPSIPAKEDR